MFLLWNEVVFAYNPCIFSCICYIICNTVTNIIFLGSKITADDDCSHEIKSHLLLGRKAMTKLDRTLKSRDITLPRKVCLVKPMVFPIVMYGCESWTIKKAESEVAQSCPTFCDPMDCSLPGSSLHGILQARVLEWVAISISRGSSWPGVKPRSPTFQADALTSEPPGKLSTEELMLLNCGVEEDSWESLGL